jgi:hypothetical protein
MTGTVAAFIAELIRAANETKQVTETERASLLRRAANTIRDYRIEIDYSDTPANDRGGPDDIVYCLNEMARQIDQFSATEVQRRFSRRSASFKRQEFCWMPNARLRGRGDGLPDAHGSAV